MQFAVLAIYCLAVLAFCVAFKCLKLVATSKEILGIARAALAVIRDTAIDDREKERRTQDLALAMLKNFFAITLKGLVLLAAAAVPALLATSLDVVDLPRLLAFSVRWDVMLITVIAMMGVAFALKKREPEAH